MKILACFDIYNHTFEVNACRFEEEVAIFYVFQQALVADLRYYIPPGVYNLSLNSFKDGYPPRIGMHQFKSERKLNQ